ncbi:MAG: AAA domain-containing protein [bacterium]
MLQEAAKLINSAFQDSFTRRICSYLHDCVREEVRNSSFKNIKQDKDTKYCIVKDEASVNWLFDPSKPLKFSCENPEATEILLHSEISQKDSYLIFGYLFLRGQNPKKKKSDEFMTPLLYLPCKLERNGVDIDCTITDDTLTLNTGALASLIKTDDEDEAEHLFEGLVDVVPDLPLDEEKVQVFLTSLKSIIPDIDITKFSFDALSVDKKAGLILAKRPTVTAGVLHELTKMAEMPIGAFRETSLGVIQEEYDYNNNQYKEVNHISELEEEKSFYPVTPLELSDTQEKVIKSAMNNTMLTICGPPGTGKSQTIVNLVSHFIASGKTVLVASRMDKAVDVVSERLNSLGTPYLCLRAGRSNYQKQLNAKLEELVSGKVDLDDGYEDSVLAEIEDLESLINNRKAIEYSCEELLTLEHKWKKAFEQLNEFTSSKGEQTLINEKFNVEDIEKFNLQLEKIADLIEKTGFINSLITKISYAKLLSSLKIKSYPISYENIDVLRLNLAQKKLEAALRTVETGIERIGNIGILLGDVKELRNRQKTLAVEILQNKRREAVKSLIRDKFKKQRLIIHSKSLVERKKNLQNRLLAQEDFKPLLEAFPCWAVTTYSISETLPLKPGLFDIAIIDESSQCDIASCFPVLFRAKKAVIVGDDKQLSHLSFLEKTKEQSFFSQYNIADRYQLMWRFRTNSIFDVASFYAPDRIMLDEHFRSKKDIIEFSNQSFYGGKIRIMSREVENNPCVEVINVTDAKVDLDNTRNMAEVEKIIEHVHSIVLDCKKNKTKPVSIGIISPFRSQVELLKKSLLLAVSDTEIKKHSIEVGTAHTFQGDEKDVILLSFTIASNSHFQSLVFAQKSNLFNVAVTRAKNYLYCYISKTQEELPEGLIRNYLEFIKNTNEKRATLRVNEYNYGEHECLSLLLEENGMKVLTNFETCGFTTDLLVKSEDKAIIVELDGFNERRRKSEAVWKQSILERCGWKIVRISAREWYLSPNMCVMKIKDALVFC